MSGTKYRPLDFNQILGLDYIKEILMNTVKGNAFKKAYLFSGEYSVGKTTIARVFARSILCKERTEEGSPCNKCPSCEAFLTGRHPGYLELDAATSGGIEDINKLKEDLTYESLTTYQIILLDECHMISKAGKDALLLELEKESDNVVFLFCTTELEKMPETLRSRCTEFYIPRPTNEMVVQKLKYVCKNEGIPVESEDALHLLATATGGHYRDAENKISQIKLLGNVTRENVKKVIQVQNEEVADLLLNLSVSIKKSLEMSKLLMSRVSVHDLYSNMVAMLVDAEKRSCGFEFGDKKYQETLDVVSHNFSGSIPGLLEYLISKDRINQVALLEADLILIHHKFLKGQFRVVEIKPVIEQKKEDVKPFNFSDLEGKSTHEKNTIIREMKNGKKITPEETPGPKEVDTFLSVFD